MEAWKTDLYFGSTQIGEVNINRGIFQGDDLSPLLFVVALIPLTRILQKAKYGYNQNGVNMNHLLYMDDLKLSTQGQRKG